MHSFNIHVHFYMYTDMKVSHKSSPVSRVNFTFNTSETFFKYYYSYYRHTAHRIWMMETDTIECYYCQWVTANLQECINHVAEAHISILLIV